MLGPATFRAMRLPTATSSLSVRAFSSTARASVARMSIVGRLAATPEEATIANGRSLVRYALGTSYGKPENRKTSWFKIAAFSEGSQKDFLLSLPKGTLLYVDADARMESFTDKEGNQRTSLNLIQSKLDVLSRPRSIVEDEEGLVQDPTEALG
ncbi:nucleic acid-binding protein [Glonium stellatum]|uniref:Nucleic acid-binding protein n=1 Tax=Glonium stellatum TaxID=574774 RepID=A0A8E2F6D0_9PEZI|nr:nucleic acid-binding protein [Glonium stellatum]